nr:DNA mismatch repair protein MutS domain containing protein [Haemonchus contortus]
MATKKQSSLFSFFTPKSGSTPTSSTPKSPAVTKSLKKEKIEDEVTDEESRTLKRVNNDHEGSPIARVRSSVKRRRIIVSSDEEDDGENVLSVRTPPSSFKDEPSTPSSTRAEISTPKTTRGLRPLKPCTTPLSTAAAESFIDSFCVGEDDLNVSSASVDTLDRTMYQVDMNDRKPRNEELSGDDNGKFVHETLAFLKPEKIRDAQGHRPDDDDYDPSTLFVPSQFLKEQTGAHVQWWNFKSKNFDTLLFFKVGKFYETFHMDAVVAVECLGLTFMRGNYAHAGFPEAAYGKFADQLVSRGYKVARVEQTETPQQLEERNKQSRGAKEKVVRREICRVTTSGTRTYAVIDGCNLYGGETDNGETQSKYLFSIKETVCDQRSTFGICFVDTSVGKFFLGEFCDDDYNSFLRTVIANFTPVQVLFERGRLSSQCKTILNGVLSSVQKEALIPKKQFYDAEETLKLLSNDKYLGADFSKWPDALRKMLDPDSVIARPNASSHLALSALGAVLFYLQRCLIDVDMVTMHDFTLLEPLEQSPVQKPSQGSVWANRQMILDGITLENLNLVPGDNRDSQAASLSLYSTVNKCQTAFGKRLLRQWICSPTCDMTVLRERQDAIEYLMDSCNVRFIEKAGEMLRSLPDLERLLQKIHTMGLKYRAESHPDSRAVMFEAKNYSKRKIKDLLNTLAGFKVCSDLINFYARIRQNGNGPRLLDSCLGSDKDDLGAHLEHFEKLFNHSVAEKEGMIVPEKGQDEEYDDACKAVNEAMAQLEVYRRQTEEKLHCKITFFGSGNKRFQMEMPENVSVPRYFELKSRRKGFQRYSTEELEQLIEELGRAEARKEMLREDGTRRVFSDFDTRRNVWSDVLNRIAQVDVLLSLARYCQTCGLALCRPEFVCDSEEPVLSIEEGYHPCLAIKLPTNDATSACSYIANDSQLGGGHPRTVLLTGPNMGGKSTLMRQVAVLTVLAHMGSFVPARSMKLSPVDRIFTRIGANDRLICGQSTFFVELRETLVILRNATKHSLVLIDELGRGTSTFDGTAIASAVLSDVSRRLQCRSFFSTHYHSLCKTAAVNPNIALAHMACMVENENEANPTEECVTFLYRLTNGVCPKSYGFFAARLAGVRPEVVKEAYEASRVLFDSVNRKKMAIAAIKEVARGGGSIEQLREMISAL